MGANVGNLNLGLNVDYGSFNQQLTGIKKQAEGTLSQSFTKLGKVAAAAFSIVGITKFTKECINLGSAISEVQNVVDVTFGQEGSKVIESFSKNAMTSIGLSELKAKKYTSTLGAMYKSMGLTGEQALGMSIEMTKLAGDMASFYNLDSDEAFNKIRSGISGETEPLKQLGINMSVANMEAYALSQGITKSYQKMTQAEQSVLRYNYLLSVTSDAQGDFVRTQDSWANQTRILSLRYETLKYTLGQAFIQVLTPVLKVVNVLMERLVKLAEVFAAVVNKIFGKKQDSSLSNVAADAGAATGSMEGVANAADGSAAGLGEAANAAKKMKKALAGFDELNVIDVGVQEDGAAEDSGLLSGLDTTVPDMSFETDTGPLDVATDKVNKLKDAFTSLLNITGLDVFFAKIKDGFNSVNWAGIKADLKSAGESLLPIGQALADGLLSVLRSFLSAAGSLTQGTISTFGSTLEIITGALASFLSSQGPAITKWLEDVSELWSGTFDNLAKIFDGLFASLNGSLQAHKNSLVSALSELLTSITGAYMGIGEAISAAYNEASTVLLNFINSNKPLLENFYNSFIGLFESLLGALSSAFEGVGTTFANLIEIIAGSATSALEQILPIVTQAYTDMATSIGNTLDNIAGTFDAVFGALNSAIEEHKTSLIDAFSGFYTELTSFTATLTTAVTESVEIASAEISNFVNSNKPLLQDFFGSFAETFESTFNLLGTIFGEYAALISSFWDSKGVVIWQGIVAALTDIIGWVMRLWTEVLQPCFTYLNEAISSLWSNSIAPYAEKFANFMAKIWELILVLWNTYLKPIVSWIIDTVGPILVTWFQSIVNVVKTSLGVIFDILGSVYDVLSGIIEFLIGVFTGDWDAAWQE